MDSSSLAGRHVVITGAGGGLGGAVVETLRAAGATCHTPSRRDLDLTDQAAVTRFYADLPGLWASVHLAGGFAMAPITDTSLEDFQEQWRTNTVSAFLTCREAVRRLRQQGQGGRLINVGSRVAVDPVGGKAAYVAAKAALVAFTRALALEIRADGILANAVLPETIDTPANRAAMPTADFSRWTPPAAIGATIAWLIAPGNQSVSGALIPV